MARNCSPSTLSAAFVLMDRSRVHYGRDLSDITLCLRKRKKRVEQLHQN
jgi:hypothetical protein